MKRLSWLLAMCALCVVSIGPIGCSQLVSAFGLPAGHRLQDLNAMLDVVIEAACRQGTLAQEDVAGLREAAARTIRSYGSDDSDKLLELVRADLNAMPATDRQAARRLISVVQADAGYRSAAAGRADRNSENTMHQTGPIAPPGAALSGALDSLDFVAPALPMQISTELSLALVGLIVFVAVLLFLAFILNIG